MLKTYRVLVIVKEQLCPNSLLNNIQQPDVNGGEDVIKILIRS